MLKDFLYNTNDKNKNNKLIDAFKSGLSHLQYETQKISEDGIKIEKPHKIIDIIRKILEFNKQN